MFLPYEERLQRELAEANLPLVGKQQLRAVFEAYQLRERIVTYRSSLTGVYLMSATLAAAWFLAFAGLGNFIPLPYLLMYLTVLCGLSVLAFYCLPSGLRAENRTGCLTVVAVLTVVALFVAAGPLVILLFVAQMRTSLKEVQQATQQIVAGGRTLTTEEIQEDPRYAVTESTFIYLLSLYREAEGARSRRVRDGRVRYNFVADATRCWVTLRQLATSYAQTPLGHGHELDQAYWARVTRLLDQP